MSARNSVWTSSKALQVTCGLFLSSKLTLIAWINTVLVLDQAQPDYSDTFGTNDATHDMMTADGGKTWTASQITIGSNNFGVCPDFDGTNVTTVSGSQFLVECNTRRPGSDIMEVNSGTMLACLDRCQQMDECVYVVMHSNGVCNLKSAIGSSVTDSTAAGARLTYRTTTLIQPAQ